MFAELPPSALVDLATELTNMRDETAYLKDFFLDSPRLPRQESHVFVFVDNSTGSEKTWLLRSFGIHFVDNLG